MEEAMDEGEDGVWCKVDHEAPFLSHLCQFLGLAFSPRLLRSRRAGAACERRSRLPTPSHCVSGISETGGATRLCGAVR